VLDGAVDALVGLPTSGQAPAREAIAEVLQAGGGLPAMVMIASLLIRLEG